MLDVNDLFLLYVCIALWETERTCIDRRGMWFCLVSHDEEDLPNKIECTFSGGYAHASGVVGMGQDGGSGGVGACK